MRAPVLESQPVDQPIDQPVDQPVDQAIDQAFDQAIDQAVEADPEVRLTRRERRAAARGGRPTAKIAVKAEPKLPPPPVRHRDYASRKRG